MSEFYDPEVLSHLQKVEMLILKDFMAICEKHNLTYFGCAGTGIGALRHQGFIPWDDDIDIALPREDYEKLIKAVEEEYGDKYHMLNTANDINYPLATTRMCLNGTVFHEHAVKNVDCDWGIFLDLYALDNAADGKLAFKWQMWCTWFWSKILILRSMPKPYLAFKGAKAKLVYIITSMIHYTMKFLHISKRWLIRRLDKISQKYNNTETKRMGYFCDTKPDINLFTKDKTFPLRKLKFEDVELPFENDLEEMLTFVYGDYMTMPPIEKRKTHFPYRLDFGKYGPEFNEKEM